jgi:predicted nucleic acid-binding protein
VTAGPNGRADCGTRLSGAGDQFAGKGGAPVDKKSVYLETSVVSYLTAWPTGDLLAAAWQKATRDWWETRRGRFDLYTSALVLEEAGRGDPAAAARRLEALAGLPLLAVTDDVRGLARALLREGALPAGALDDALHIALAATHGTDYLLTWNFRHIDNAEAKPLVRSVCIVNGQTCPEICTPQELMGVIEDGR